MAPSAVQSTVLAGAPWEARVLAMLPEIGSADDRLQGTLELMRRSPVPWSDGVEAWIQTVSLRGVARLEPSRPTVASTLRSPFLTF